MAGEPNVTVCGNATGDAEIKFLSSGDAVCSWNLACTPRVKKNGEWADGDTVFYRCSVWRQQGENCAETITRGMRLLVHGRLKVRRYETNEGESRTSVEIDVEHVGPELRYATAKVNKVDRSGGSSGGFSNQHGSDDPWGSPPPAASGDAPADEPPF